MDGCLTQGRSDDRGHALAGHKPDLAILPIGGHYTMGPAQAAVARDAAAQVRCVFFRQKAQFVGLTGTIRPGGTRPNAVIVTVSGPGLGFDPVTGQVVVVDGGLLVGRY